MAALSAPARVVSTSLLRLQSDERLAALARDGHEAAFDALVTRYRDELVRASARIVGESRAEDAVQQALLNAHRALDTTADVQNLRAWLHKITHNSSLNLLRSLHDEVPLDAAPAIAAGGATPEELAALRDRLAETLQAIDALPENQRAALLLREFEGRSHEDIAAALAITPGAARQALMRGRQTVRHAVSALTPYGLIAKFATASSTGATAGLAEIIGGAGAGATMLKLGATVAATGAIAGGVVGADLAVKDSPSDAAPLTSTQSTTQSPRQTGVGAAVAPLRTVADDKSKADDKSGSSKHGSDDKSKADDKSGSSKHGSDDKSKSDDKSGSSKSGSGKSTTTKGKDKQRENVTTSHAAPATSGDSSSRGRGADDSSSGSSGSSGHGSDD